MSTAEREHEAPTAASFHARLRPRPGDAFLSIRALAISLGPDVIEHVEENAVTYLRRDRAFMSVRAERSRLHVAFPRDAALDDPSGRLLKRGEERYVALEGPEAVDGHVQEFIRKAYSALR